jgi:hypothetical protein
MKLRQQAVECRSPLKRRAKDNVVRGNPNGRKFDKIRRTLPECNNDIRDRGANQQLLLRKKRTLNKILRRSEVLEIANLIVRSSVRLRRTGVMTLWRGRSPSQTEEETTNSLHAGAIGTPANFLSFAHTDRKKKMAIRL